MNCPSTRSTLRAIRVLFAIHLLLIVVTSCGRSPNPSSSAGRAKLQKIAETALPILTSVREYHRQHQRLPESPELIGLTHTPAFGDWRYFLDNANSYRLFCQTGWDPMNGLWFFSTASEEQWLYDPGDGSPDVDLTSEFSKQEGTEQNRGKQE